MQGLQTAPLPIGHTWTLPGQQQQQQQQQQQAAPSGTTQGTSPSHMSGLIMAASQLGLPLPGKARYAGSKPFSAPSSLCMLLSDNASNGSGSSPDKSSDVKERSSTEKTGLEDDDEYRRMRRRLTNRESAQRIRHKSKESLHTAVEQARVLAEENCRLQHAQTQSNALVQQLQSELSQWRAAAQNFAAENQHMKRRLTQCEQEIQAGKKRACGPSNPAAVACSIPGSSFMLAGLLDLAPAPLLPLSTQEQVVTSSDPFTSSQGFAALVQPVSSALDLALDVGLGKELSAPFDDWGDILQHDFPL